MGNFWLGKRLTYLSMFEKVVVIDCKDHLLGRLASTIAKEILNGQKVVCVRTEDINISGSLFRNKIKFEYFLKKRMLTNPKKGPIHFRSPARILWRTVRGMLRHKTPRGANALARMSLFEGIPAPYDKMKRVVVPGAIRNLRLKPGRKYCRLGDLAAKVGWGHNELVTKLEDQRKVQSAAFYNTKSELAKLKSKAIENAASELGPINSALAAYGH